MVSLTSCSALSAVGIAPSPSPSTIAGVDPSTVTVQPEFSKTFGPQVVPQVTTLGLRFLEVTLKDHPEYTLSTFKQTQQNWIKSVGPKMKPILSDGLLQKEAETWTAGEQGAFFGVQSKTDGTYTAPSGEVCHLSDTQPLDSSVGKPEVGGSGPATFSDPVGVTMHCKDGKSITVTLKYDLEMVNVVKAGESNPSWQINSWHIAPASEVIVK